MKKISKILILILLMHLILGFSLLAGCSPIWQSLPKHEEREVGDFIVIFSSEGYCYIKGTTEQGNSKRFLVVPEQIEGVPVYEFGKEAIIMELPPEIKSDVLEKIFIEGQMQLGSPQAVPKDDCPNFKKIIWVSESYSLPSTNSVEPYYYPRIICENHAIEHPDWITLTPANVSYYYNYENAENYGYYWVDDCDYGGKIEFIPNDPIRDGYTFGGWYKEAECINQWDFDNDTLPEEKTELKEIYPNGESTFIEVPIYQETILYAKWIK